MQRDTVHSHGYEAVDRRLGGPRYEAGAKRPPWPKIGSRSQSATARDSKRSVLCGKPGCRLHGDGKTAVDTTGRVTRPKGRRPQFARDPRFRRKQPGIYGLLGNFSVHGTKQYVGWPTCLFSNMCFCSRRSRRGRRSSHAPDAPLRAIRNSRRFTANLEA